MKNVSLKPIKKQRSFSFLLGKFIKMRALWLIPAGLDGVGLEGDTGGTGVEPAKRLKEKSIVAVLLACSRPKLHSIIL